MINNKSYKFSEVVELVGGGTPKTTVPEYWNGNIPWLSVVDFNTGSKYVYNTEKSITTAGLNNSSTKILKAGDIIISARGTVGAIAMLGKDMAFNQSCYGIKAIDNISDNHYLYYALKNAVQNFIQVANGGVFDTITRSTFEHIDIMLPSLPQQKAVASILSGLDDKIDLLHRQNKTLESMAEALFKERFVVNAKEDWEEVKLENYVACFNGVSYKSTDLNPSETALVTLKNFDRSGGMRLDGFKEYTGKYKEQHVVEEGDLVVAHTDITQDAALIGNPIYIVSDPKYKTLAISMDLVKVKTKFEWLSLEFLYLLMRSSEFKEHCLGHSNGSTVLHLSKSAIPSFTLRLPPQSMVIEFTTLVKPLLKRKLENTQQIRTLTKLRDTLLPKLMSGEVRVEESTLITDQYANSQTY